jgi:hypothetical protein
MQTQKKLIARIDGVIDLLRHAGVVGTGNRKPARQVAWDLAG